MKIILAPLLAVCFAVFAHGQNMIPNPGFEEPVGRAFAWEKNGTFERCQGAAHSGQWSMCLNSDDDKILSVDGFWKNFELKTNTNYTLSGWIKTAGSKEVSIGGIFRDEKGNYLGNNTGKPGLHQNVWTPNVTGDKDWVYMERIFNSGTAPRLGIILCCTGNGGTAWFDDLELKEGATDGANLFNNSSFKVCATPGYPDWWGVNLTVAMTVKDWETGNYYGIDSNEKSPVLNTSALRIKVPEKGLILWPNCMGKIAEGSYTLSVYLKSDTGKSSVSVSGFEGIAKILEAPKDWTRQSVSGMLGKNAVFFSIKGPGMLWIAAPQLEFGDKLSDWKAASGDAALTLDHKEKASANPQQTAAKLPIISAPPVIDGQLDDPCWGNAWKAPAFLTSAGNPAEAATEAWLACDNNNIYVAFKCHEKDPSKLKNFKKAKSKMECYKPDSVEIFVAPGADNGYLHIAVNPAGDINEEWSKGDGWVSGAETATARGDGFWTVELAIPFANMRKADSSSAWSANLCRTRVSGDKTEYSSCAGTASFHDIEKYFKVSGIPSKINIWSFESPKILSEKDGSKKMFVSVKSPGLADRKFKASLKISGRTWEKDFVMGQNRVPLVFNGLPAELDPDAEAEILVFAENQSKPAAKFADKVFNLTAVHNPSSPVKIFSEYSWYPEDEKIARVKIGTYLPGKSSVKVSVLHGTATVFSGEYPFSAPGEQFVEIPLSGISSGELRAEAVQDGETLAYAGDNLTILPPKKNSVRLDRFTRSFVINGEPFFPLLFHPYAGRKIEKWVLQKTLEDGYNGIEVIFPLEMKNPPEEHIAEVFKLCEESKLVTFLRVGRRGLNKFSDLMKNQDKLVSVVKDFPSLVEYLIMDEPDKSGWEVADDNKESDLLALANAARKADPYHPVTINYYEDGLVPGSNIYGGFDACDFNMFDIYPYMRVRGEPLEQFALKVRDFNAVLENFGRCVCIWLPVWGAMDAYRVPTPDEWQNMAFTSIIHGSRGLLNWMELPYSVPLCKRIREVNWKLREISSMLISKQTLVRSGVQGKVHYAVFINGNDCILMVANTASGAPAELELDLENIAGMKLKETNNFTSGGINAKLSGGKLKASFEPKKSGIFKYTKKFWLWWV